MKRAVKWFAQESRKPCGFNPRHHEVRTGSDSDRLECTAADSERPEF